jgi:hypothetical protein
MREADNIPFKPQVMPGYRDESVKLLYGIILAQFIVIAILLGGYSSEYLSNDYFRIWVNNNFPQLGLLLTGQADALIIGMSLGGTLLLIQRMKNQATIDQKTATPLPWPPSSTGTSELLPNHATPIEKSETTKETPEQVLGELEKQDF